MYMKPEVLLVDDNEGILESLGDIFGEKGFVVSVAINGYLAIHKTKEQSFDVIIIDIRMPGIKGVETF